MKPQIIMMEKFSIVLMFVLFFGAVAGSQPAWAGEAYHGKVVDAETGEPIEGAAVVVYWIKKPLITMDGPEYFHNSKEVLTDAVGKFSVDASPGKNWNPFRIMEDKPTVAIFKPGYGPYPNGMMLMQIKNIEDTNHLPKEITVAMEQIRKIDDAFRLKKEMIVPLPKLKTNEELHRFTSISSILYIPTCSPEDRDHKWECIPMERIPNLVRLVNIQRKGLGLDLYSEPPSGVSQP